jgi:Tol biopolymer transport system component
MITRLLVATTVVLACVAAACGGAASSTVSPCRWVTQPMWSPDGTQIVYYGRRWPAPKKSSSWNILRALCTMRANGTNVQPVRYTACSGRHCPEPPTVIAWTQNGILYQSGGAVFRIVPGNKPQQIASPHAVAYAINPAGTRLAAASYDPCDTCAGPLTIYDAESGAVVGKVGGKKLGNVDPSLSPDGLSVAFDRFTSNQTGKSLGIWAENINGRSLRQLVKVGLYPLWSPTSAMVAYQVQGGSLHLVSAAGGKSRTLVPGRVENVFGWSPNGRYVAFAQAGRNGSKLAVVNVATRKVRALLRLYGSPAASWAPDSLHLVVNVDQGESPGSLPPYAKCGPTYLVSLTGSAPVKIASCTS